MSDSRTQSVCGERFNKHVNMVCNLEKGHSHMHHFEPVAEPASTGEMPLRKVSEGIYTSDTTPHRVDEARIAEIITRAARPSGYCPYHHGEKLVPIFGGQWNGCPKCPRDADGFTPAAPQASAELRKCTCPAPAQPGPEEKKY